MEKEQLFLDKEALKEIASGACFLASGGGGPYDKAMEIANNFSLKPIEVWDVERAGQEKGYAVVTALIGSPEKLKSIKDGKINKGAIEALAEVSKVGIENIKCIVPAEIGAVSTLIACVTAAEMKLPVVDGDGAGRAVPTLNMTTFAVNHELAKVNPSILFADKDNYITLNVTEGPTASSALERLVRPTLSTPQFDGVAAIALWLIDLKDLQTALPIQGTLSKCLTLGISIRENLRETETPDFDKIKDTLSDIGYTQKMTLTGTLKSATTATAGGFDNGIIHAEIKKEEEAEADEAINIVFQNESLLLWSDKQSNPRVLAPDLISYFIRPRELPESGTQWVYSNGDIMDKAGELLEAFRDAEITIIGMEAPSELRDHTEVLNKLVLEASEEESTLYDSYRGMLEELNYFGKVESSF